jgi:hypothetical protein
MAPSASSPRIGRGFVDSALTLKNQLNRPDDSRPARTSPVAGDSTRTGGSQRELPESAARTEVLDAKWQSAIDAATD